MFIQIINYVRHNRLSNKSNSNSETFYLETRLPILNLGLDELVTETNPDLEGLEFQKHKPSVVIRGFAAQRMTI